MVIKHPFQVFPVNHCSFTLSQEEVCHIAFDNESAFLVAESTPKLNRAQIGGGLQVPMATAFEFSIVVSD
jgi:hypothetical protein